MVHGTPRRTLFLFCSNVNFLFLFYNFPLGRQSDQNDSSNGLLAIYICVCQIEFSTECFALSSDWGFSPDPIHLVVTARRIAREREKERERRSRLIIFVPFSILLRRWGEVNAVVVRDLQLLRLIVNYLFDSLLFPTELSPAFTFFLWFVVHTPVVIIAWRRARRSFIIPISSACPWT